jgi:hypothetical protein
MSIIVSFPRSGQHLIENILNHCCKEHNIEFTYCEFYSCCNSIPCENGNEFSKNHDFHLDLEINESIKYVAVYRKDLILQLESYYRYITKLENKKYKYKDLLNFVIKKSSYYTDFVNKWIDNENENILKVEYYNLLENPENLSRKIFQHFYPEIKLDNEVFKNLNELEFEVKNTPGTGIFLHKISPINKIDERTYKKLKKDLGI